MALSSNSVGSYISSPYLAKKLKVVDVKCNHGLKAHVEVCKRGQNLGKLFFSCPLWNVSLQLTFFLLFFLMFSVLGFRILNIQKSPCGYFRWVHDVINKQATTSNVSSDGVSLSNEESKLARLEAKCERLKEKKAKLAVAYEELKHELLDAKNEVERCKEMEKGLCRLLFASWVGFCIGIVVFARQVLAMWWGWNGSQ